MRKWILFVALSATLTVSGQEISSVQNWIFDADTLEKRKIEMGDFRIQGENQTWDLKGRNTEKIGL